MTDTDAFTLSRAGAVGVVTLARPFLARQTPKVA